MQAVPYSEEENREWWENRQAIDGQYQRRYHVVTEDQTGVVIGYGAIEETPDP